MTIFRVGERASESPTPEQFTPGPFCKTQAPDPLHFEVNLVAEAGKMQHKSGVVQVNIPGFSPVKLYCDEQPPVGEDTAPPPLAFFCAGIGFCLMTHLTDIFHTRNIQIDSLKLEQRVRFMTTLGVMRETGATTTGATEHVETHVIIESPESQERIEGLLAEAEASCMAHYALRNPVPWSTRLVHNGAEIKNHSG